MIGRPLRPTPTATLFPYTPLFRSREFLIADLEDAAPLAPPPAPPLPSRSPPNASQLLAELAQAAPHTELALEDEPPQDRESVIVEVLRAIEIGRASCRERVCQYV